MVRERAGEFAVGYHMAIECNNESCVDGNVCF